MKAKEYVDNYHKIIENGYAETKALAMSLKILFTEVYTLQKARKVSTGSGMIAIYKELDQKWRAIIQRLGNQVSDEDLFVKYIRKNFPETIEIFDKYDVMQVKEKA